MDLENRPAYPAPKDLDKPVRQRYKAEYEQTSGEKGWPRGLVRVTKDGETVYEYTRNYSFYDTFEPFRQWDGAQWRNYALISPNYTSFEVLDLEKGEVIAKRPHPETAFHTGEYERLQKEHPEYFQAGGVYEGKGPDDTIPRSGFCPAQFYVPDFASWDSDGDGGATDDDHMSTDDWNKFADIHETHLGQLGFVAGCYWGDDTSWKIQAIDLSRISEGIVSQDERFGYISLPPGMKLRQAVTWLNNANVTIATSLTFKRDSGKMTYWQGKELPEVEEKK